MNGVSTGVIRGVLGIGAAALLTASTVTPSVSREPAVAADDRPNIVVIVTDDQDVKSLPSMRKLMSYPEGSWVDFRNAFTNQSLCCPARATLLTGQYAHETGVTTNENGANLDDSNTLPVWLNDAGYRTGLFGKYLNDFPWDRGAGYVPPGWDVFEAIRGEVNVRDADTLTQRAVSFLGAASTDPFLLYVAYREPHHPASKKVLPRYRGAPVPTPVTPPNFNEADVSDKPTWVQQSRMIRPKRAEVLRRERSAARRALLGVDDGVARIIETLKATGELDNTIIIFVSDNGYSWGSHRWEGKNCGYDECIRIPLLIRFPGAAGNRDELLFVSNVDVAPTLAEYAGVTPSVEPSGRSLIPLLAQQPVEWRETLLLERHSTDRVTTTNFWGVRAPGWMYAEYLNGVESSTT